MLTYPELVAATAGFDLDALATATGLTAETLSAVIAGGRAASPAIRERIARVLGANPIDLFRLEPALEEALAGAPTRYVTDPATLRTIDRGAA